jgi:hypothetical protein
MELMDHEIELKERLIRRIESTHKLGVLRGVLSILDEFDEEYVYELTPEEEEDIEEGIRQSKAGLGIPHKTVMAEVREWLQTQK